MVLLMLKNDLAVVAIFSTMSGIAHTHGASSPWVLSRKTVLSPETGVSSGGITYKIKSNVNSLI